nr:tetratricopeptide repeat protein [Ningiella sp. W23]
MAIYFKRIGRLEESLKHAKMAYKIRPTLLATRNLAIAYLTSGKRVDALKYLKEVLSYNPNDIVTLKTVADVYLLSGDLKAAENNYQKLIDSGRQSASIYSNYSIALSLQGEFTNALNFAQKAMMLDTKKLPYNLTMPIYFILRAALQRPKVYTLKLMSSLILRRRTLQNNLKKRKC